MSSFPFLPRTISLVDRHSGIYQGTARCRCSHSTGAITADTVQIERSGCSGTSADSEHLYSITHSPGAANAFRRPPPSSYFGHLRPQREQRNAAFLHLTRATRTGASRSGESSMDTSSTTMPLTLSKRLNIFFIRRFLWFFFLVEKQTYRKRPSHPHNQRLNDETTPTKTTQEPEMVTLHLEELLPMCNSSKRFPRL